MSMFEKVQKAKEYLKCKIEETPKYVVVLGSGLGSFVECLKDPIEIKYEDIPGWPLSTAPGHAGRLVYGKKENANVLVMQGRVHYY
ncbi:MAG: purine-nucleoside phosphorylase, partial [Thermovirga sp.]|nr:purine-nucleoside phosphorylase [Thermovirga sp.]